jgi:hypothetical protein
MRKAEAMKDWETARTLADTIMSGFEAQEWLRVAAEAAVTTSTANENDHDPPDRVSDQGRSCGL